ncbi:MAG: PspC domain-containing protein [Kineosporiaceae bacterium]|nr:PspC domain-containing protein [Kineosporiaceae bacterium]MBK7625416.1 PspC domain-containing protein [Kineosporiaceae bacterium]MBK8076221.1 PspC domain-containing protein [Kineosporiaceae bacterium]
MTNSAQRTLSRSDNRVVGGVCSGLADYFGIDVTLVRIVTAVLVIFGGAGVPLYLAAWLIMPDGRGDMIAARVAGKVQAKMENRGAPVQVPNPYAPNGHVPDAESTRPSSASAPAPSTAADTAHEPPAV